MGPRSPVLISSTDFISHGLNPAPAFNFDEVPNSTDPVPVLLKDQSPPPSPRKSFRGDESPPPSPRKNYRGDESPPSSPRKSFRGDESPPRNPRKSFRGDESPPRNPRKNFHGKGSPTSKLRKYYGGKKAADRKPQADRKNGHLNCIVDYTAEHPVMHLQTFRRPV